LPVLIKFLKYLFEADIVQVRKEERNQNIRMSNSRSPDQKYFEVSKRRFCSAIKTTIVKVQSLYFKL